MARKQKQTWGQVMRRVRRVTAATPEREIENLLVLIGGRIRSQDTTRRGWKWEWVAVEVARNWRRGFLKTATPLLRLLRKTETKRKLRQGGR